MRMKSHFHVKEWEPRLALRKRLKAIRKWPIAKDLLHGYVLVPRGPARWPKPQSSTYLCASWFPTKVNTQATCDFV